MTLPYKLKLEHDPQGRISKKTETVADETVTWTYAYDKAGRLAKCERNGWPVCDCWYDRVGRRAGDSFPKSVEGDLRRYEYDMDNRLSRAGKNSYMHDDNGFRSMWNHKGKYIHSMNMPRIIACSRPTRRTRAALTPSVTTNRDAVSPSIATAS